MPSLLTLITSIFLGLLFFAGESRALNTPFDGGLNLSSGKLSLKDDGSIRLRVVHLEGIDEVILRRVIRSKEPSYFLDESSVETDPRPFLYRGVLKRAGKDGVHRASADLINGTLRVTFHGRRRGRLISVSKNLRTAHSKAKANFVASFSRFACGAADFSSELASYQVPNQHLLSQAQQTLLLSLSADADYEFYQKYGAKTFAEIESIINTVDSIYLNQLNLDIQVNDIKAFSGSSQPYKDSEGTALLEEFRVYNNSYKRLKRADAYHLFTGKSIQPYGMVGLSYVGAFCQEGGSYSYGLTQYYPSPVQVIITAHEIAHGLGATHTDSGIMMANLSSNPRVFSSQSISEINSYVQRYGTCLSSALPTVSLKSISYSKKGRFKVTLVPSGALSENCQMQLFGSTREAYLSSKRIFKKAKNLVSYTVSRISETRKVNVLVKADSKKRRRVYLRAVLRCGALDGFSKIVSLQIRNKKAGTFFTSLNQMIN